MYHFKPKPRYSMYGIFTYIYHKSMISVGKHSIHGAYGKWIHLKDCCFTHQPVFLSTENLRLTLEEWRVHLGGKTVVQVGCTARGSQIGNATHPPTSTKSKASPDFLLLGFSNLLGFSGSSIFFCFSLVDDSMIH